MILIKKLKYNLRITLILLVLCSSLFSITASHANPKEIGWDDLIPWTAVLNPSEVKFNEKLNNKEVKIPGYIIPLEYEGLDIKTFLLVPYIGACIHVPPPPANQIVYVDTAAAWDSLDWWEPVYVTGTIMIESRQMEFFEMVDIGYEILAGNVESYEEKDSEDSFFFW